jgi:hypothetical protein
MRTAFKEHEDEGASPQMANCLEDLLDRNP